MLAAGFPVDAMGQYEGTPLHWAAFHGNAEMTREILRHNPPLEQLDRDFRGTPLGRAIHGSEHGWHAKTGDYPYPRVNDDGTICTDLTHFRKVGDEIVFIRRSDGRMELKGWRDQLLCVPASSFLAHDS
jgi:hypothetical protein